MNFLFTLLIWKFSARTIPVYDNYCALSMLAKKEFLTSIRENCKSEVWNSLFSDHRYPEMSVYDYWVYEKILDLLKEIASKDHTCEVRRKNVLAAIENYSLYGDLVKDWISRFQMY
jgi:hypothetical protein